MSTNEKNGVFSIIGSIVVADQFGSAQKGLLEAIDGMALRSATHVIPHATTNHAVSLQLPTGVTEALLVYVRTPRALKMRLTAAGAVPGPIALGAKGVSLLTLAPGSGVTALAFDNADLTEDVIIDVVIGCQVTADDVPTYWA